MKKDKIKEKIFQAFVRQIPFIGLLVSFYFLIGSQFCYKEIGTLTSAPSADYFVSTTGRTCVRYSFNYVLNETPNIVWKIKDNNDNQKYAFYVPLSRENKIIVNALNNKKLIEPSWLQPFFIFMIVGWFVCIWISLIYFDISERKSPYLWPYRFFTKGHRYIDMPDRIREILGCNKYKK